MLKKISTSWTQASHQCNGCVVLGVEDDCNVIVVYPGCRQPFERNVLFALGLGIARDAIFVCAGHRQL